MKFATLAACPVFGGKVAHVDDAAAKALPGVQQVIVLDNMVAVVGDHMWAAKKGLDALKISWSEGEHAKLSSADIWQDIRSASQKDGVVAKTQGDIEKGLANGQRFEADYELPFLAHAPMEPLNCTVWLKPDSCELWLGTQIIARVQQTTAALTGLPIEKVTIHNHLIGGGFGRRLEPDMALNAVRIAQHMNGVPVKVVWTREEDIQQDIYRPIYRNVISASLVGGKGGGLEIQSLRRRHHRALATARLSKGDRCRRRRQRRRYALRHPGFPSAIPAGRAAGRTHRFLARRRPQQQCVRHRELYG